MMPRFSGSEPSWREQSMTGPLLKTIRGCVDTPFHQSVEFPPKSSPKYSHFFLPEVPNRGSPIPDLEDAEEELRRVVTVDLLRISQVCSRWHRLVRGTSSLWSTVGINLGLWRYATAQARMAKVLTSLWSAGVIIPLWMLECFARTVITPLRPSFVSCQFSRRWRKATIEMPPVPLTMTAVEALSSVKGNLPLLQTLQIDAAGSQGLEVLSQMTSLFEVVPRLIH
ncbi:hypothetical protein C8F04DRAFT_623180 [Mycena alexandri]|uniref:F-box domain-containing protein n=1 Tax=Mycena alexandri TaxID=1745969 RepID=A0AAD6SUL1_9AGAR|nr:hypothetical protein C8F04DRAFT_623180 [Mycena alexandri]